MAATLHFFTGKGGVGKSTLAAAAALNLAQRREGPVLLLEIQGSGHSLRLLGLERPSFDNQALPAHENLFGARLLPRESFKQYFGLLLSLGNDQSSFAQMTAAVRGHIVQRVMENKVVSAFVDVCPGLEPAVLLGKVHWEASAGTSPEEKKPWAHVVVDAPATGHGLMLFKSTFALLDVFGTGTIFRQAARIREFMLDAKQTHLYLVTLPEELPLQETREMREQLQKLGLQARGCLFNRCPPPGLVLEAAPEAHSPWAEEAELQKDIWREQSRLIAENQDLPSPTLLPEIVESSERLERLAALLGVAL